MTPNEFYAIPTGHRSPWHDEPDLFARLFGHRLDDDAIGLDMKAAEADGNPPLAFETKLRRHLHEDASLSYAAATLDGTPFAIVVSREAGAAVVTDPVAMARARAYVAGFRRVPEPRQADPAQDLDILAGTQGHRIMEVSGAVSIVRSGYLGRDGNAVFDETAFDAAFDRLVRPAFPSGTAEFDAGLAGERMRALVSDAIVAGLAPGVAGSAAFDQPPRPHGQRGIDWIGAIATDGRDTYGFGVMAYARNGRGFSWCRHLRMERIGDAGLFTTLDRRTA